MFIFAFIFHCLSFSPCWLIASLIVSLPLWIFMFFFLRNPSPLFSIPRPGCYSVIHVSVNIKNNAEKDTNLLLFFLSKSRGGHAISFPIKSWVAFGLPYLMIELFYIGMLWCGRIVGRQVYGNVTTQISRMFRLPNFVTHGALLRTWESSAINILCYFFNFKLEFLQKCTCIIYFVIWYKQSCKN